MTPTDTAALRATVLHAIEMYSKQRTVITSVAYSLHAMPAVLDELQQARADVAKLREAYEKQLDRAMLAEGELWDAVMAGAWNPRDPEIRRAMKDVGVNLPPLAEVQE